MRILGLLGRVTGRLSGVGPERPANRCAKVAPKHPDPCLTNLSPVAGGSRGRSTLDATARCLVLVMSIAVMQSGAATPVSASEPTLRPVLRPEGIPTRATALPLTRVAGYAVRPALRPEGLRTGPPAQTVSQSGFDTWVRGFRSRALRAGIQPQVFDRAFRNAKYLPDVVQKDRNQAEFNKTIWEYLDRAVSDSRVKNGKRMLRKHRRLLDRIEARYGVEKEVVVAVWGMESAYGARRGDINVISAMATLAFDGRRRSFFEKQLVAALKILQRGDTVPRNMTGSWAGAMGHTQFIPTSYQALAVDFDGDGRRDIWADDPTDALASTANYLAKSGWRKGMPWGVEVRLPSSFDFASANRKVQRMPSEWARLGVLGTDGRPVPDYGSASVLLPAGAQGAAFLIFRNFRVIERYNAADAYVIGVGHLSDRITGGAPIQTAWPRDDRNLTAQERLELQTLLTRRGFDTKGIDGKIGPATRAAVKAFQRSVGMPADGRASFLVLKRLRS